MGTVATAEGREVLASLALGFSISAYNFSATLTGGQIVHALTRAAFGMVGGVIACSTVLYHFTATTELLDPSSAELDV